MQTSLEKESIQKNSLKDKLVLRGDKSSKSSFKRWLKIIVIVLLILFIGLLVGIIYLYYQTFGLPIVDKSNVVSYLSKIAVLPNDSTPPVIAQILDPSTLQKTNNLIFTDAQKGDLIIVYKEKAILFRPGINKIIEDINLNGN